MAFQWSRGTVREPGVINPPLACGTRVISLAAAQGWGMLKVRFDMKKTRNNNPLRAAAAMMLIVALGSLTLPSRTAAGGNPGREGAGATPVARGMLIPARMRLMVRYNPSRTA